MLNGTIVLTFFISSATDKSAERMNDDNV